MKQIDPVALLEQEAINNFKIDYTEQTVELIAKAALARVLTRTGDPEKIEKGKRYLRGGWGWVWSPQALRADRKEKEWGKEARST